MLYEQVWRHIWKGQSIGNGHQNVKCIWSLIQPFLSWVLILDLQWPVWTLLEENPAMPVHAELTLNLPANHKQAPNSAQELGPSFLVKWLAALLNDHVIQEPSLLKPPTFQLEMPPQFSQRKRCRYKEVSQLNNCSRSIPEREESVGSGNSQPQRRMGLNAT